MRKILLWFLVLTISILFLAGCDQEITIEYSDGSVYKGTVHNGLRHGHGTMNWSIGASYTGDFEEDVITGKGR